MALMLYKTFEGVVVKTTGNNITVQTRKRKEEFFAELKVVSGLKTLTAPIP